jgi:hypothetical protein
MSLAQQLRQLGDIRRDPPRLIASRGREKKPQQVSAGASFWVAKGDQIPNANTAWAICVKIQ